MTWIALILFCCAIALWRHSHRRIDEISKVLTLSSALVCFMVGLAIAPIPLQMASLLLLLSYPVCGSAERTLKPDCPRFCLMRHQCKPSRKNFSL